LRNREGSARRALPPPPPYSAIRNPQSAIG
jgi:hypothetical protein